jgi:hypothetical protein
MPFDTGGGVSPLFQASLFEDAPLEDVRPSSPTKKVAPARANPITLDPAQTRVAQLMAAVTDLKDSLAPGELGSIREAPELAFAPGQRPVAYLNAVAGGGKSRSLIGAIGEMGRHDQLLLSTFGKEATAELEAKAKAAYPHLVGLQVTTLTARTINALGHRLVASGLGMVSYKQKSKAEKEEGATKPQEPGTFFYPEVAPGEERTLNGVYLHSNKYSDLVKHESKVKAVTELLPKDPRTGGPKTGALNRLLKLTMANLMRSPSARELEQLVEEHDIRFRREGNWTQVLSKAIGRIQDKGLEMLQEEFLFKRVDGGLDCYRGCFSYEDQTWVPFILDLKSNFRFSRALIDERQDLSIAQLDVLKRVLEPDAPVVFVGDVRQAIYGFNGAGGRALEVMERDFPGIKLELNDCYRCPETHLALARHFNPKIRRAALAGPDPVGTRLEALDREQFLVELRKGDVVLSRSSAVLLKAALKFVARTGINPKTGKPNACKIVLRKGIGGAIAGTLRNVSEGWKKAHGKNLNFRTDFTSALAEYSNAMAKECPEGHDEDFKEQMGLVLALYEAAHDRPEGSNKEAFANYCSKLITESDAPPGKNLKTIEFRTVHSMKGGEADRIFLVDLGTTQWIKTQLGLTELRNIRYVALTRSKRELFLVTGFSEAMDGAVRLLAHPVPRPED